MKNINKNLEIAFRDGIEGRLGALIVLTAEILRTIAKAPRSKQVSAVEDKAINALFAVGMPQIEIGKLLGVDTHRVNDLCKKIKNK